MIKRSRRKRQKGKGKKEREKVKGKGSLFTILSWEFRGVVNQTPFCQI
jgi:hypothetical protein